MHWFLLAIIGMLMFGLQSFLYKTAIDRGANKYLLTSIFLLTVEILAIIFFFSGDITLGNLLILSGLGLLFAIFFYTKTILQMKSLEKLPTYIVFPITSTATVIVILYSVFFLGEILSVVQILGIILIVASIILIRENWKQNKRYKKHMGTFAILLIAMIAGAGMEITNKHAATSGQIPLFIVITYLFSTIISFAMYGHNSNASKDKPRARKEAIQYGIMIGIVNMVGYFSYLASLKVGPLSIISPLIALSVVITVLLSKIFGREELTNWQMILVAFSVLGIVLLRI